MSETPPIDGDLACIHCGYNLRGLVSSGFCPECGVPVATTLAQAGRRFEDVYLQAGAIAGLSSAACAFVSIAVKQAVLAKAVIDANKESSADPHIGAWDICVAVRELAEERTSSHEKTRKFLQKLGLCSSEDVGRAVFALVELGLAQANENDSRDAFNGLFTLESLFEMS